jgi:hypothetical protein
LAYIDKIETHRPHPDYAQVGIPLYDSNTLFIVNKLNELIDVFNNHYHETLDTHYNTTSPKVKGE